MSETQTREPPVENEDENDLGLEEQVEMLESRLEEMEERVDSMDRGLAGALGGIAKMLKAVEVVIDPGTEPESKDKSLAFLQQVLINMNVEQI